MAKLSQNTREQMARRLVLHRYEDQAKQLCATSSKLFNDVLDDQYDAATRKLMDQLSKRRPNAFLRRNSLGVNVAGRDVELGQRRLGNQNVYWVAETGYRDLLSSEARYRDVAYLEGPLAERIVAFADAADQLRQDAETAYRKALGALAQFGTGKRLAEGWPEAMPVIGGLIPEDDRALPVVQVAALNAEFDLPPELAVAA